MLKAARFRAERVVSCGRSSLSHHVPCSTVVREAAEVSMMRSAFESPGPPLRGSSSSLLAWTCFETPFRVWVPVGPGLVFKNTGCSGWCTISSPIVPQPPQRSPLSLLPAPNRARVTGDDSTHREEVGELPIVSSSVASSLRTRDPRHVAGRRRQTSCRQLVDGILAKLNLVLFLSRLHLGRSCYG
jgi:hypothetical protein